MESGPKNYPALSATQSDSPGAPLSRELADLIAKLFISRRDVKAIQGSNGHYYVDCSRDRLGNEIHRYPWTRAALEAHLEGAKTYGHYLLNKDDTTKLFAFDIDLEEYKPDKPERKFYYPSAKGDDAWGGEPIEFNPRKAWQDRRHPARPWMKYQFKMTATKLMQIISKDLGIPCAAAYSGGKGVHVYGFTGSSPAWEAREGAAIVMESLGEWVPARGDNFFKHKDQDFLTGYPNLSIEVFPKQDSLQGKDLGNLMRLPLGRNLKSKDPTFFIDMSTEMAEMKPIDPIWALTEGADRPWSRNG